MSSNQTPPTPTTELRKRLTAERRGELLRQFGERKMGAEDFARDNGIGVSTLYWWQRKARGSRGKVRKPVAKARSSLNAVNFSEVLTAPVSWVGELCLPDGTKLRWKEEATATVLKELVRDLRRPC